MSERLWVVLILIALALAAWFLVPHGQSTAQAPLDGYGPADASLTGPNANSGGARFNFSPGNPTTPSSPLVLAPTSVPMNAGASRAAGIVPPTPLVAPRTDAALLESVQAQLARLDPEAQPSFVHMRPTQAGELQQLQITGHDDGNQVFVVVACPQCNAKALVPTIQTEVVVDYLTFVCDRRYAGCSVIAGKDSDRVRQIRGRPSTVALPTAVARRGPPTPNTVPPPFSHP
jgi:hypothetical protein